jgi:hypothetical protein
MTMALRHVAMAIATGAAMSVVPLAVNAIATPAPSQAACNVGQIDGDGGCRPFCLDNELLNTASGECLDPLSSIASALRQLPPPQDWPSIGVPAGGGGGLPLPPISPQDLPQPPQMPQRPLLCGGEMSPIPFTSFRPCI